MDKKIAAVLLFAMVLAALLAQQVPIDAFDSPISPLPTPTPIMVPDTDLPGHHGPHYHYMPGGPRPLPVSYP